MSSNFGRLPEIINEAYAENFSILSQKLANPLLYLALHFLIGIPFFTEDENSPGENNNHDNLQKSLNMTEKISWIPHVEDNNTQETITTQTEQENGTF